MTCTCNTVQYDEYTCFNKNCNGVFQVETPYHMRISKCPLHKNMIAICSFCPHLCQSCINDGYYIDGNGIGFCVDYQLKNKNF